MAKYVKFGGVEHPFETEKEKKALIKEAKKYSRYLIVDGISITAKLSASDCAMVASECGRAKDNK
jgi:hypothetical protein